MKYKRQFVSQKNIRLAWLYNNHDDVASRFLRKKTLLGKEIKDRYERRNAITKKHVFVFFQTCIMYSQSLLSSISDLFFLLWLSFYCLSTLSFSIYFYYTLSPLKTVADSVYHSSVQGTFFISITLL